MSMQKGNIIKSAMLKLGNITDYNDDRSRKYQAFSFKLDEVLKDVSSDNSLRFNSTTIELTTFDKDGKEYKHNLPNDFLGLGRAVKKPNIITGRLVSVNRDINYRKVENFRIEGEYIYSNTEKITLNYVRNVPIEEMPQYLEQYLVWKLAKEAALIFPEYTDRLNYCEQQVSKELFNVQKREGTGGVYY